MNWPTLNRAIIWVGERWDRIMLASCITMIVGGVGGTVHKYLTGTACEDACHPLVFKLIDDECHCVSPTGWDRLEDE